jgi:hypothetical protein
MKEMNQYGAYKLRKYLEWTAVTLDAIFTCYSKSGPIFSRGNGMSYELAAGERIWKLPESKSAQKRIH